MAYTPVPTKNSGDPGYSADDWNIYVRDNFAATTPDVFTAKGDLFIGTGADTGAIVTVGANNSYLFCESAQAAGVKWSLLGRARAHGNTTNARIDTGDWASAAGYLDAEDFDTASALASGVFTAPHTAYYLVVFHGYFDPILANAVVNDYIMIGALKNGALYSMIAADHMEDTYFSDGYLELSGADIVYLNAGDTLEPAAYASSTNGGFYFRGDANYSGFTVTPLPV